MTRGGRGIADPAVAGTRETAVVREREDPDSLIVGGIRDGVTAGVARRMALQGKRVLSTARCGGFGRPGGRPE